MLPANRVSKSRLFAMIFSEKENLLQIYNALKGTTYKESEQIKVNTLENAIYMSMHNDVSFLFGCFQELYEHQSTYNPNMPLRFLLYVSDLFSGYVKDKEFYSRRKILLPVPEFWVFYNGKEKHPETEEMKLSDCFQIKQKDPSMELKVTVYNINPGFHESLKSSCTVLGEYAEYTSRVRAYTREMDLEEAVERAITECIKEGILKDFLEKNRAEAKNVSIYEYDEEKHLAQVREEGREEGEERLGKLMMVLLASGRNIDAQKAAADADYRRELYKECCV